MLLVGSAALSFAGINLGREPNDYDLICYRYEFDRLVQSFIEKGYKILRLDTSKENVAMCKVRKDDNSFIVDASLIDNEDRWNIASNAHLWFERENYSVFIPNLILPNVEFENIHVIKPEVSFMMKKSHQYKSDMIHFEKTRKDILTLENRYQMFVESWLQDVYQARKDVAEGKHYKLNVKKDEFFTDNVKYVYDHDDIHEVVKLFDKPAYRYYLKDGEQVMCDKDKFFSLPVGLRNAGVFEEACVLAIERAVVPFKADFGKAFNLALKKVCTSITSGWFREYAWQNYDTIKAMGVDYRDSTVFSWEAALEYGLVRKHGYDKEMN